MSLSFDIQCFFRSFDESKKSEKSIASMIVKSKEGEQGGGKKDQKKKTVKIAERAEEPQVTLFSGSKKPWYGPIEKCPVRKST